MLSIRTLLTLTITLCIFGDHMSVDGFIRVCYFASWQRYKTTYAQYFVGDIDPSICTHLVYAFGKLDRTLKQVVAAEAGMEEGPNKNYWYFNNLKQSNPSLKTLLSIGGQNDHSDGFIAISATSEILQNFVRTTINFLRERNFDGLDIDWEYPDATTKDTHVKLLKALREGFDNETSDPSKRLLLTIAGAAGQWFIDPGYNVPEVAKYIDFANLMTYDYTGSDAVVTAFNSPLYSRSDPRFNPTLSTNWTVHYWNQKGLPFSKIVVGVTGVGRRLVLNTTLLANNPNALIGAATTGEIRTAPDYQIPAGLAYPEICEWLNNSSVKSYFDDEQKNPYLVKDDNWVGYEDERSIEIKVKWMADLGVAGFMFWSLDQDDFRGDHCGKGKYPLLNAVIKTAPTTTSTSTTTTTTTTTTKAPTITTKAPAATTQTPVATTKKPTEKPESSTTTTKKATPQTEKPSTDENKSSDSGDGDGATSHHSPSMVVAILMACIGVLLTLF